MLLDSCHPETVFKLSSLLLVKTLSIRRFSRVEFGLSAALLHSNVLHSPVQPSRRPQPNPTSRTSFAVYAIAILLGLFAGWVNQTVDDALLTALCVLAFTMTLGVWKSQRPWRWVLLVWVGVPIVLAYYHFIVRWPHDRGQVYGAFLQLLAASAGGFGGHFMRQMIDHVFLKQGD